MIPLPDTVPPSASALLAALARELDDGDLHEIAHADWSRDVRQHQAALSAIARELIMPVPLGFEPREVLELTRWLVPEEHCAPRDVYRGHLHRAFCCTVLLRALGDRENQEALFGQNQTLANLIASLRALGRDLDREAAQLLTWLIPRLPEGEPEEHAFHGLGLLWFLLGPSARVSDEALLRVAEWVMVTEDAYAGRWRERIGYTTPGRWLLDGTGYHLCHDVWKAIGRWLPERLLPHHSPPVVETVTLIGVMLTQ